MEAAEVEAEADTAPRMEPDLLQGPRTEQATVQRPAEDRVQDRVQDRETVTEPAPREKAAGAGQISREWTHFLKLF